MPRPNPIQSFVDHQGVMVLDGGLATTLEAHGQDLDDPLWSARVLLDHPELIAAVHRSFLEAGADCIATATYQATVQGLANRGLDSAAALALFRRSVDLACDERDEFWDEMRASQGASTNDLTRLRPLVAASVGPFGAFLADGSEYTGDYGVDRQTLVEFHTPRWDALTESRADLIACETIPSGAEAEVLISLTKATPSAQAWISFSCADAESLVDGSSLFDVARACDKASGVVGVGVNCVPPQRVAGVLDTLARATSKPRVVYPNTGELYDAESKTWRRSPPEAPAGWLDQAPEWVQRGAGAVGGCCRTTPADIRSLRELLL